MIVSLVTTTLYATIVTFIRQAFDFIHDSIYKLFVVRLNATNDFRYVISEILRSHNSLDDLKNKYFINNEYNIDIKNRNVDFKTNIKYTRDVDATSIKKFTVMTFKSDIEKVNTKIIDNNADEFVIMIWRWDLEKFLRIAKYHIDVRNKNTQTITQENSIYVYDSIGNKCTFNCPLSSSKLLTPSLQKEFNELNEYLSRTSNMTQIGNGDIKRYFIYGSPGGGKTHFSNLCAVLTGGTMYSYNLQKILKNINKSKTENTDVTDMRHCYGTILFDNVDASDLLFTNDKNKSNYGNMATLCDLLEGKYTPNAKVIIMIANVPEDIPPEVRLRMRRGRVDKIIYVPNMVTKEQCIEFIKLYDSLFINEFNKKYILNDKQIDKIASKMAEENLTVAEVNEIVRSCIRTPFNNWLSAIENEKEYKKFSLMNFDDVKEEIKNNSDNP
uniref:ATPase AAA-type core domain-containing protein n=1 Tax=viral metagenome TaxID=1070528 RepID=A0A6C0EBC1_9ZZZZ